MLRYKTNKQAFIIAALVILLCLVSLTGATLALFTSDPKDGTIGIVTTSGSVKVDIIDTAGVTLQNRAMDFLTPAGVVEPLFEPGATFYTQEFLIENKGNIPINYFLSVGKDDIVDVDGRKVDINVFNEAFEIWIVRAEDPDFANAERLTDFKGTLKAGEVSEPYCLFVQMKETADNDFQNQIYSGIGVTVYAVQGNVEIKG